MTPLLFFAAIVTMIKSALMVETVHKAIIGKMPPEFRSGQAEKFVVQGMALEPSTPLPMQRRYVVSSAIAALAVLLFALAFISMGESVGWLVLAAAVFAAGLTVKYWMTYRANCRARAAERPSEQR